MIYEYFKVLYLHSDGETEENHKYSVMTVGKPVHNGIKQICTPNISRKFYRYSNLLGS